MRNTLLGIGLLATGILTTSVAQATVYTLIPLTDGALRSSQAQAINNVGVVAGQCDSGRDMYVPACMWNNAVLVPDATLLGFRGSIYNGINDQGWAVSTAGWAVGLSRYLRAAYLWDGKTATELPSPLSNLEKVDQTAAYGINNAGLAVGETWPGTVGPNNIVERGEGAATLWVNKQAKILSTLGGTSGGAYAINNATPPVIVGGSSTAGTTRWHATRWVDGVAQDLGTLGGSSSSAAGVNDAGLVVGQSRLAGDTVTHATLWRAGTIVDLGALDGTGSVANGVNAAGQIVGAFSRSGAKDHAVLWNGTTAVDLNTVLAANPDGWELNTATAINDKGVIVGTMSKTSLPAPTTLGYMLVPSQSEPQPVATCTVGYKVVNANSLTFTAEVTIVNKSATASGAWLASWTYATGAKPTLLSSKRGKVILSKGNGSAAPLASAPALAANGGSVVVSFMALDWGKLPTLVEVHATLAGKACDVSAP